MAWMAWTMPTALFFGVIAVLLLTFSFLAIRYPEEPRLGILNIATTRGDRLFISLLGSAYICLIWMYFINTNLWWSLGICFIYAFFVFKKV